MNLLFDVLVAFIMRLVIIVVRLLSGLIIASLKCQISIQ
jgi:hypothetical protein